MWTRGTATRTATATPVITAAWWRTPTRGTLTVMAKGTPVMMTWMEMVRREMTSLMLTLLLYNQHHWRLLLLWLLTLHSLLWFHRCGLVVNYSHRCMQLLQLVTDPFESCCLNASLCSRIDFVCQLRLNKQHRKEKNKWWKPIAGWSQSEYNLWSLSSMITPHEAPTGQEDSSSFHCCCLTFMH